MAEAKHTPSGMRRPALGATSAGREQWNSLPPLPFAGDTLLSWDVARRASSDPGPTGYKRPTETHPEELRPWGTDSERPEGESVTVLP